VVLLAFAAAAQERPVSNGVNFFSLEKEAAMGAQVAAELRSRVRVIESRVVQEHVGRLTRAVADQLPPNPYSFRVEVYGGEGGGIHEPAAVPGGHLFIPSALILEARNEAELAGMLAHATAHVVARHGTRDATRGQLANISTIPLIFVGGWTTGDREPLLPLGFLKFARQNEMEADRLAIEAMAAAGYRGQALYHYIDRTQQDSNPARSPLPPRAERLTALEQAIANLPAREYRADASIAALQEEVRRFEPPPRAPRPEGPPTLRRRP
jgi:predicted Zn-dependent protease